MKLLYIIGCGMGVGSITAEAVAALSEAQVVIGSPRQTEHFSKSGQETFAAYRKSEVDAIVASSDKSVFALLVSGDTGFYSAAAFYADCPEYWVRYIAGISSVSYFFAKCRLPWQNAKLLSAHGRDCCAVNAVRRNYLTFLLTGGNVSEIAGSLCEHGFANLRVYVGESLGAPDEMVNIMSIKELQNHSCSPLTVLIVENPDFDARQRTGIADREFFRTEGIPMTKSLTRAAVMSALSPAPGDICWDIGCGTGSVSVEMALAAYEGRVFAVDKNPAAAAVTLENRRAFHICNIEISTGTAPEALEELPAPSRVFVGGSCGKAEEIVAAALSKNPSAKIVITAVSPQSAAKAIDALENAGIPAQVSQLSCAHSSQKSGMHLMLADNPVYVISGGDGNE